MGKGDWRRPSQIPKEVEEANYEAVFGKKKLNVMSDEEREEFLQEKLEVMEREEADNIAPGGLQGAN